MFRSDQGTHPVKPRNASNIRTPFGPRNGSGIFAANLCAMKVLFRPIIPDSGNLHVNHAAQVRYPLQNVSSSSTYKPVIDIPFALQ